MQLSMQISYAGGYKESAQQLVRLEQAGLDIAWIAEAYSYDAPSYMGYLAALTERVQIGAGILPLYTRTPDAARDDRGRASTRCPTAGASSASAPPARR